MITKRFYNQVITSTVILWLILVFSITDVNIKVPNSRQGTNWTNFLKGKYKIVLKLCDVPVKPAKGVSTSAVNSVNPVN